MFYRRRLLLLFVTGLLALGGLATGCDAPASGDTAVHPFQMADLAPMPAEVQTAPVAVQQAYQFAVANPDVLKQIPCYCGCGNMGHTSNYACYVAGTNADGALKYDPHALGCSICVDITQDTMRLLNQGKSVSEIRAVVDETYSRYGPSNMP
jgi:hypothetical protein